MSRLAYLLQTKMINNIGSGQLQSAAGQPTGPGVFGEQLQACYSRARKLETVVSVSTGQLSCAVLAICDCVERAYAPEDRNR